MAVHHVHAAQQPCHGHVPAGESGLGRENGKAAIEHFTQLKSVYVALAKIDAPY